MLGSTGQESMQGSCQHGLLKTQRKEKAGCWMQGKRISKSSCLEGSKSVLLHFVTRLDLQQTSTTQQHPVSISYGVPVKSPQLGWAGSQSLAGRRLFLFALQDVILVMKGVSYKTADRSRDVSVWRSVRGEYTKSAVLLPPALHLGPCTGLVCLQGSGNRLYGIH